MNKISRSAKINRNFYTNLRKRGRTHFQIMRMIQPNRLTQFTKDVYPIIGPVARFEIEMALKEKKEKEKLSTLERIYNFFSR